MGLSPAPLAIAGSNRRVLTQIAADPPIPDNPHEGSVLSGYYSIEENQATEEIGTNGAEPIGRGAPAGAPAL